MRKRLTNGGLTQATWLVAIFTFVLGIGTIIAAGAALFAASIARQALTDLERPFAALLILNAGLFRKAYLHKNKVERYLGVGIDVNDLSFCFTNYGRSPAILLGREDRLRICESGRLPPPISVQDIREQLPYGVIVAVGDKSASSTRVIPRDIFPADQDEWPEVQKGNKDVFLMGILRYQNISGTIYEMKFCAVFDPGSERFQMRGGQEYNSHKQVE